MKIAAAHNLYHHYTGLLRRLKVGAIFLMSKRAKASTHLVPKDSINKQIKVDWTKSAAFLRDRTGEKILTAEEIASVLDENKGRW